MTTIKATTTEAEAATTDAGFDRRPAGRSDSGRPAGLLAELFEAHAPLVLGLCRSMLRDRDEGEDAAQQTFLSAYSSLLVGTRPRDPAAWLSTIARNECRTRAQRRMREPLPVANPLASVPAPEPADAADVEALRLALAELPRRQRRAFLLREFSGLSYAELGIALGLSQPAVESLLFRARRGLKGALRAAAAAAVSLPATIRDSLAQLLSGDPSGPTTIAKLASLPLAAKLASMTAGTALVVAGAVEVSPAQHHRAAPAAPRPAARSVDSVRPRRAGAVSRQQSLSFVAARRPVAHAVVGRKHRDEAEHQSRRDDGPAVAERRQAEDRGEVPKATPTPVQQPSGDDVGVAAPAVRGGEDASGPDGDSSAAHRATGSGESGESGESSDSGGSSGPGS